MGKSTRKPTREVVEIFSAAFAFEDGQVGSGEYGSTRSKAFEDAQAKLAMLATADPKSTLWAFTQTTVHQLLQHLSVCKTDESVLPLLKVLRIALKQTKVRGGISTVATPLLNGLLQFPADHLTSAQLQKAFASVIFQLTKFTFVPKQCGAVLSHMLKPLHKFVKTHKDYFLTVQYMELTNEWIDSFPQTKRIALHGACVKAMDPPSLIRLLPNIGGPSLFSPLKCLFCVLALVTKLLFYSPVVCMTSCRVGLSIK
eukprot:m.58367 g.58367  ORF g.58367 m.58367 type:complete len:256 (-) comp11685_c0_seq3:982-1749(-)